MLNSCRASRFLPLAYTKPMADGNSDVDTTSSTTTSTTTPPTTTTVDLVRLLSTCVDATRRGSRAVRLAHSSMGGTLDTVVDVEYKVDGDVRSALTSADVAAQRAIVDSLTATWGAGLTIVGEEDLGDDDDVVGLVLESPVATAVEGPRLRTDLCRELTFPVDVPLSEITVFVDPLDGTREFVEGRVENVQTLVGVAVNGVAVAGAVGLPFAGFQEDDVATEEEPVVLYGLVGAGSGRSRSDDRTHKSEQDDGDGLILARGDTKDDPILAAAYAAALSSSDDDIITPQFMGGTGTKILAVTRGRADVAVMNFKSSSWDTCATEALLKASGGLLTDLFGDPVVHRPDPFLGCFANSLGVVASTGPRGREVHARICRAMRENEHAVRLLQEVWGDDDGDDDDVDALLRFKRDAQMRGLPPHVQPPLS